MMLFKIAWRNIWRHPARSVVIMASVALGLWAGMLVMSFYFGFAEERVASVIETDISHIQIHHPKFKDEKDLRYNIPSVRRILAQIQSLPQVKCATSRLITSGMIASANGSSGIEIHGVVPESEDSLIGLSHKVMKGTYFGPIKANEMLVGEKLAEKLKVHLGSKLITTFQDTSGSLTAAAFRIAGIFKTKSTPYDESNVFVKKVELGRIISDTDRATEIAILLYPERDVDSTARSLRAEFPTSLIQTWREISPELNLIISMIDQMMYIFMGIVLLAMAFGIVNTMLMAILERTREIGMLIALGMNRRRVFSMVILETIFLVLAGTPFGMTFAYGTILYFGARGIDISAFSASLRSFGYSDVVYTRLNPEHYAQVLFLVVITALLSSLFPARKALRLQPAEAIRK